MSEKRLPAEPGIFMIIKMVGVRKRTKGRGSAKAVPVTGMADIMTIFWPEKKPRPGAPGRQLPTWRQDPPFPVGDHERAHSGYLGGRRPTQCARSFIDATAHQAGATLETRNDENSAAALAGAPRAHPRAQRGLTHECSSADREKSEKRGGNRVIHIGVIYGQKKIYYDHFLE